MTDLQKLTDEQLKEYRKQIKNKKTEYAGKSLSQKILLNSGYGALSNEFNRWYSDDVAESITLSGQMAIRWCENIVNQFLNNFLKTTNENYIVAIDTDSLYIKLDALVEKAGKDLSEEEKVVILEKFSKVVSQKIDQGLEDLYKQTNAFNKKLFMSLESIGPAIWVAKKRYVMSLPSYKLVRYNPPKIKIQGIDAVRSSTPEICRKYIKDAVPLLIEGNDKKIKDYIEEKREDFIGRPFHEVAFPRGTNSLEKYHDGIQIYTKGTPQHVRAALLYNRLIKDKHLENDLPLIQSGDKIRFCYMKMPNPMRENTFACPNEMPPELDMSDFIDYNLQFDKAFFQPLKKIVDAAKINLSDAIDISQFFTIGD